VTRVLCVGLAALDTILVVPELPASDGRVVASQLAVAGGGPAATAAVALARLGVDVAFAGAVGDDEAGAAIRAGLEAEGVDVSRLVSVAGARSPRSTILVEEATGARSIVHFPGTAQLPEVDAAGAEWVHVDHAGWGRVRPGAARLSVDGGNPIPGLDLRGAALYAPTEPALAGAFGDFDGALAAGAETVVVTRGAGGSAARTAAGEAVEAPGVDMEVVSTLGAGDVFHGALLAFLVRGSPLADALAAANLCAALSCRALDGRSAIPTMEELERNMP
jgi:sugar/nucleoside kinase (ribokinase family)